MQWGVVGAWWLNEILWAAIHQWTGHIDATEVWDYRWLSVLRLSTGRRLDLIMQDPCRSQQLLYTLTFFYLNTRVWMHGRIRHLLSLILLGRMLYFRFWVFADKYGGGHSLFGVVDLWFALAVATFLCFDHFLLAFLLDMIDRSLYQTVSHLFALPLVQFTHSINLLNQFAIFLHHTFANDLFLLLIILFFPDILEHGEF